MKRILKKILAQLPQFLQQIIANLYYRYKGSVVPYSPEVFFESFYRSTSEICDKYTISPNTDRFESLYHYKTVERGIIEVICKYSNADPSLWTVLDVGSGAGHWVKFFEEEIGVKFLVGIEIAPTAARRLSERFQRDNDIEIVLGDISNESLDLNRRFDVVCAIGTIFHIVDDTAWERSITNVTKHLKNEGIGIIGGEFGMFTRNARFIKTNEFNSWEEYSNCQETNKIFVYKRLRSRQMWHQALKRNDCAILDIIPANCRLHTPENNLLVFKKVK